MSLDDLRSEIDTVDHEIVRLLNRRAKAVCEIGKHKAENDTAIYDPTRESEVYKRVAEANDGPLPAEAIRAIWREVMSAGLSLQRHTRVAYFGPAGTFTHQAARARFGSSVDYVSEVSIPDVFASVATGRAELMVDPICNPWDVAAILPVVIEAGGKFTDWKGNVTARGGDGLGTNGNPHAAVLEYLKFES